MKARPGAAGLALVAALFIGILIGRGGNGDEPTTPASPTPTSATVPSAGPGGAVPTLGPIDTVMYELPGGMRVPHSPTAGPTNTDNHLASGFAHTPLGAVVAGINIAARTSGSLGEPIYQPTVERQVMGEDQPALLRMVREEGQPEVPGPEERTEGASIRIYGFTVDSYAPAESTISYLMIVPRNGQQVNVIYRLTVRWVEEDWKLVAPLNGDFTSVTRTTSDPSPFHSFT